MAEVLRSGADAANQFNGSVVSNQTNKRRRATKRQSTDKIDNWFPLIAKQLIPSNAGLVLHSLTGIEERTCYRYAAGDTQPSGKFLLLLLASEQGRARLSAMLADKPVKWWAHLQRAERVYNAMKAAGEDLK